MTIPINDDRFSDLAVNDSQSTCSPAIKASAFSPDGNLFATLGTLGELSIWKMEYPTKPWAKSKLEMKPFRTWVTHYPEANLKKWKSVKIVS